MTMLEKQINQVYNLLKDSVLPGVIDAVRIVEQIKDHTHEYKFIGGVDEEEEIPGTYEQNAEQGTYCGDHGIKHKMKRWDCYRTECVNKGCNYKI
jgi:hypothetical protein